MSRRGAASTAPSASSGAAEGRPARVNSAEDERFNDEVHAVLRDAAELREGRAQAVLAENIAAARRSFDAVLALSRSTRKPTRG